MKVLRYLLLAIAFFGLGMFLRLQYQRYESKEKYIYTYASNPQISAEPPKEERYVWVLSIPKINKKLRIDPINVDTTTDANNWPISTIGVNYVSTSPQPGRPGNSIIYGHNWKSILGDLKRLKVGDDIIVYSATSEKLVFKVNKINIVDTTDASLLENSDDQRLTLYTCTGLLDSKRLVVTAFFVEGLGGSL